MLDKQENFDPIVYTVREILKAEKLDEISNIISSAQISIEQTYSDNWDGGTNYYTIYITIDVESFVSIRDRVQNVEATLLEKFNVATRHIENERISKIIIVPKAQTKIDWSLLSAFTSKDKLIDGISYLRNILVSVSTGGERIQNVEIQYKKAFNFVDKALQRLNIKNPNPFRDLWEWYGQWHSSLPSYRDRRAYIGEMYNPIMELLEETVNPESVSVTVDLTGWERIERSINEIRMRQNEAKTEEQFQVVGLLCRETIISLGQAVYDKDKHPSVDGIEISKTDTKRMLESYIAVELSGSSNESFRRYAKITVDLANEVTHKRSASKKEAAICATATISLINLIGTIEGRI